MTYWRIGHAPSHGVPHLIRHSVRWRISSAKTIRPRNGWSERFRVHHHFVMRVHHSVHAERQSRLSWTTCFGIRLDQSLMKSWYLLLMFFSTTLICVCDTYDFQGSNGAFSNKTPESHEELKQVAAVADTILLHEPKWEESPWTFARDKYPLWTSKIRRLLWGS